MRPFVLLLALTALLSAGEIGREERLNSLTVLRIETITEMTVFVQSSSPEATGVQVTAIIFDSAGKRRTVTRMEHFTGVNVRPVKLTIPTDGDRVTELRIMELRYQSSQTLFTQ